MFNFNMSEIISNMESRLFKKANSMEKISDSRELDKPITNYVSGLDKGKNLFEEDIYTERVEELEKRVSGCPIEGHNGHWDGLRGDSKWIPDREATPTRYNPDGLTWGQILDKYGIDGIDYKDGNPDFSSVSRGEVEIDDFTDDRTSNFAQADEALAIQKGCSPEDVKKWREENGYTWHECRDCKTMQKVPREIHNNMDHTGGVSEYKKNHNTEGSN